MLADIYSYNAVSDPVKNLPEPVSSVWLSRLKILCASSLEKGEACVEACLYFQIPHYFRSSVLATEAVSGRGGTHERGKFVPARSRPVS